MLHSVMSAGRDAVFPHTHLPHVSAPTTFSGTHVGPKHLKPRSTRLGLDVGQDDV